MIPKHFHFIFGLKPQLEPFHLAYYLCLKSCLEVNQPDVLSFYYHYEPYGKYWNLIKPQLNLEKVDLELFVRDNPAYLRHQEGQFIKSWQLDYAHQADFIRLKKLIKHGGVYADMDTLFVAPIPEHLYSHKFVIGREQSIAVDNSGEKTKSLCNALMMAESGAEYAKQWLEQSYSTFDGSWSKHSCQLAATIADQIPEAVHVVPPVHFFKHMWTTEGIHTLFEGLDTNFEEVYSTHMWNHLWWDEARTDFSTFHAGRLTKEYIRNVDTTYNVIARKYLP
jgi:hypothetical protein